MFTRDEIEAVVREAVMRIDGVHVQAHEAIADIVEAWDVDAHEAYKTGLADATEDDNDGCPGHESTSGPIGNVVYCDGTCS